MGKMTWVFFFTQYWITLTFKFPLRCQFHWHNPFHHHPFILSVGPMVISPLSLLTLIICLCLFLISLVNVYQFLKKILFTFRVRRRKRQRHSNHNELYHFLNIYFFICLFVSFLGKGEGKREREGEKHLCVVASYTPHTWGPGLQPRHVPWLGIKPMTLWFTGQHSVHWAIPARARLGTYYELNNSLLI